MKSSKKSKSHNNRLVRYVKNVLVSGIKGIYQEAKENAKDKHNLDMDVKRVYKQAWQGILEENKKANGQNKLDINELKALVESAKKQVAEALNSSETAQEIEKKLMGLDFDDVDLEDEDLADMGVEDISELVKPATDAASELIDESESTVEEPDRVLSMDKSRLIGLVLLFISNCIKDDQFQEWVQEHRDGIRDLLCGKVIDNDGPTDVNTTSPDLPQQTFNSVSEKIDNLKDNEVVVRDVKTGMIVTGSFENMHEELFDSDHAEARSSIIFYGFQFRNMLKELADNLDKDSEAEAMYTTFLHYVYKVIDYYNTSKDIKDACDELLLNSVPDIRCMFQDLGFTQADSLRIYCAFYLNLIPNTLKDRMISTLMESNKI